MMSVENRSRVGQAAAKYFAGPRKSVVAMLGEGVSGSNGGVGDSAVEGRAAAFHAGEFASGAVGKDNDAAGGAINK